VYQHTLNLQQQKLFNDNLGINEKGREFEYALKEGYKQMNMS
jgi:hypothetical protein